MRSSLGLGASLKAAVLAAVLAALLATAWHGLVTEPLIDQAIELEEEHHGGEADEPIVSRRTQRLGLGVALLLYGVSWGLALGGVFALAQEHLPGRGGWRATLLGLAAGWAVALLPYLKYPANPPGVGDPETIGTRQVLYLAILVLGSLGALALFAGGRRLSVRQTDRSARRTWLLALGAYLAYCAVLYAALPPNPDLTPIPPDLLAAFRLRSALGLALFWVTFPATFGLLVAREHARAATSLRPKTLPEAGQP